MAGGHGNRGQKTLRPPDMQLRWPNDRNPWSVKAVARISDGRIVSATGTSAIPQFTARDAARNRIDQVPDHRGKRRDMDVEVFAPPPPAIGRVLSVESTLKVGQREWSIPNRILMSV